MSCPTWPWTSYGLGQVRLASEEEGKRERSGGEPEAKARANPPDCPQKKGRLKGIGK